MKNGRVIMSISLPLGMGKEVRRDAKEGGYATVSEYFRALIRDHMREKLARELAEESKDMRSGKGKVLKSLKDLK